MMTSQTEKKKSQVELRDFQSCQVDLSPEPLLRAWGSTPGGPGDVIARVQTDLSPR